MACTADEGAVGYLNEIDERFRSARGRSQVGGSGAGGFMSSLATGGTNQRWYRGVTVSSTYLVFDVFVSCFMVFEACEWDDLLRCLGHKQRTSQADPTIRPINGTVVQGNQADEPLLVHRLEPEHKRSIGCFPTKIE